VKFRNTSGQPAHKSNVMAMGRKPFISLLIHQGRSRSAILGANLTTSRGSRNFRFQQQYTSHKCLHTGRSLFSNSTPQLAEVGRLEAIKTHGNYDTGQMFLHRIFGYRGVVLFPWSARVYDRDVKTPSGQKYSEDIPKVQHPKTKEILDNVSGPDPRKDKEVKGRTHTYYQVL
jgi:hypothetical protein